MTDSARYTNSAQFVAMLNDCARSRPELKSSRQEADPRQQRILVALDASPQSVAALQAAAALATLLRAEITGLFVEDADLERLCSLPFSAEVGAYSATARALSHYCITREFHALEDAIRLTMQRVAQAAGIPWSLKIVRGGVTRELMDAADEATMVSLGRFGWSRRNQMGSTAASMIHNSGRPLLLPGISVENAPSRVNPVDVIKLVYTGTEASDRALRLAHRLAVNSGQPLLVYYIADPLTDSERRNQALAQANVISLRQRGSSHIIAAVQSGQPGITVIGDPDSHISNTLVNTISEPLLLVS